MMWLTRRRALIFGVIILVLGGFWWFRSRQASKEQVVTYTVGRADVAEVIVASGEVVAEKIATLRFPAVGKLGYVNVSVGEKVKKGKSLAGMDTADLASAEVEAYYRYLAADANAKEVEDLVKNHDKDETFSQKNDRVTAQTLRDIAYDNWREAQRDLHDAHLVSPLLGIITDVSVSAVGASVAITDGVTVVDPASLYFSLEVDEADVGDVTIGQPVEVELDAYPDTIFTGSVAIIAFQATLSDSGATVYPVKIKLESTDLSRLRLGMNGDAKIILKQVSDALTLPLEAIVDGKVKLPSGEEKNIEVGIEGEEDIEIKSGLNEGEQVVAQ